MAEAPRLILASGSSARRKMLTAAGVSFEAIPADIDENVLQWKLPGHYVELDDSDIAATLAAAKAVKVSKDYPGALVIGSDQTLMLPPKIFDKARNIAEAGETLCQLRGQTHLLTSAVALAQGGNVLWQTRKMAHMTMRKFTDAFLDDYLLRAGACLTSCVGAYEYEGLGAQLFERIEGDYFTILGMPLLPLLEELRARGVLAA